MWQPECHEAFLRCSGACKRGRQQPGPWSRVWRRRRGCLCWRHAGRVGRCAGRAGWAWGRRGCWRPAGWASTQHARVGARHATVHSAAAAAAAAGPTPPAGPAAGPVAAAAAATPTAAAARRESGTRLTSTLSRSHCLCPASLPAHTAPGFAGRLRASAGHTPSAAAAAAEYLTSAAPAASATIASRPNCEAQVA